MEKLKLKLTFLILFAGNIFVYSNESVRSKGNEIITEYLVPVFAVSLLLTGVGAVLYNADLILDKNNEGTRYKGFANVGMTLFYVFVGLAVIAAIVAMIRAVNFSI